VAALGIDVHQLYGFTEPARGYAVGDVISSTHDSTHVPPPAITD